MERMTRVYVAGKLNDMAVDYLHNVHKMMDFAEAVRLAGFSILVPAVDLLMGIKHGYNKYEDYFDNSQPWLMAADAVITVPGWETSDGTRAEIETAEKLGIPVFHELSDLIEAEVEGLQRMFIDELDDEEEPEIVTEAMREILREGLKNAV